MNAPADVAGPVQVLGFQIVDARKDRSPQPLSRVFVVRAAAEEFLRLALPAYPGAYLRTIYGLEGPRSRKASNRRSPRRTFVVNDGEHHSIADGHDGS